MKMLIAWIFRVEWRKPAVQPDGFETEIKGNEHADAGTNPHARYVMEEEK